MLKRVLQGSAALAAAGIACYFWLVRAPLERLEEARARHLELQREYVERQKYRINLPLLRAQAPVMKDVDNAARFALPDFDGIGAAARDLEQAIREAAKDKQLGARLEITIGDWSSREFYYLRPFTLRVQGEFRQVVELLHSVSTDSLQLRSVKSASLRPVAGREEVALSLDGLAYRYREEESAIAERKAKTRAFEGTP